MKTFNIHMTLKRDKKDSEFDNINQVKSEIITWLEDLGFFVDFNTETYHEKFEELKNLVDDLGWDYDRMSSSGQETYDKLCKVLGWKFVN